VREDTSIFKSKIQK